MKEQEMFELIVWVKPLLSEATLESLIMKGNEDDFKVFFQTVYGEDEALYSKVLSQQEIVLGKGTYGFKLSLFSLVC